jgi:hypothetical protein
MPGRVHSRGISRPPQRHDNTGLSFASAHRKALLDEAAQAVSRVALLLLHRANDLPVSTAEFEAAINRANVQIREAANGPRTNGRPVLPEPTPQLALNATREDVEEVLQAL